MKKGIIGLMTACMLFNLVVVSHTQKVEAATTYEKASSISEGDIVLLVCDSKTMEFSGFKSNYGTGTSYTTVPNGAYPLTVVQGSSAGTYALQTKDSKYLNWSSGNSLSTATSVSSNSLWNITFNNGDAIITNGADSARKLQWNAGSPRFACYTSNQTAVQLYKKVESTTPEVPEDINSDVNALFASYYNEGSYTKYSILNTSTIADDEVAKYFHASADTKYRKTVYSPKWLKMTTSTDGKKYENESIYKDENGKVVHTGLGGDWTVNKESVEAWFVTLKDFVDASTTGWTKTGTVYSHDLVETTATLEDDLTKMAREFVAPMWLAPNADNYAYAQFTRLTVEEVSETLVMKLYVDNGDILVEGSNNVFSQVTISKESESLSTLATFEFGANGAAADGTDAGTSLKFEVGKYTLELTGMSKVFKDAYDAKGNSCLKLGTSSAVGSFSFTVPEEVRKVIINVAKYKNKATKIKVNGTEYIINNSSDNGEYDIIEVDTSSTKTVTFTTVTISGEERCMINSIEYHK